MTSGAASKRGVNFSFYTNCNRVKVTAATTPVSLHCIFIAKNGVTLNRRRTKKPDYCTLITMTTRKNFS